MLTCIYCLSHFSNSLKCRRIRHGANLWSLHILLNIYFSMLLQILNWKQYTQNRRFQKSPPSTLADTQYRSTPTSLRRPSRELSRDNNLIAEFHLFERFFEFPSSTGVPGRGKKETRDQRIRVQRNVSRASGNRGMNSCYFLIKVFDSNMFFTMRAQLECMKVILLMRYITEGIVRLVYNAP